MVNWRKRYTKFHTITEAEDHSQNHEDGMVVENQLRVGPIEASVIVPNPDYSHDHGGHAKDLQKNESQALGDGKF